MGVTPTAAPPAVQTALAIFPTILPTVLAGGSRTGAAGSPSSRLQLTADGRILFPVEKQDGQSGAVQNARPLGEIKVDALTVSLIPDGKRLKIEHDPSPVEARLDFNAAAAGSLGGGVAQPVAAPLDLKLVLEDISSGQQEPLSDALRQQEFTVALPPLGPNTSFGLPDSADTPRVPGTSASPGTGPVGAPLVGAQGGAAAQPAGEFAWLIEVREDGQFLGYFRLAGQFDPISGKLVYRVPASLLEGTLFLPVLLQPAWVANHDPDVHIWSSPFKDAVDFGPATGGEQWTVFPVLAPQVGRRLLVFNPVSRGSGWIDVAVRVRR